MKKNRVVSSGLLAVSIIEKLSRRKREIERMRVGNLTKPLVKEWQRLKLLEKAMLK